MSDATPQQADNTIREAGQRLQEVKTAFAHGHGQVWEPTDVKLFGAALAALKVLEDAASGRYSQADLDFAHDNTDEYFDKWRAAVARADALTRGLYRLIEATEILSIMLREPAAEGLMTAEDYRTYLGGAWLGVDEAIRDARAALAVDPTGDTDA